jgi:glycosyltransferase involved in cell wall biosynthesis
MSATVIIPTTGSPELRKAIDSVLKQTYPTTCYVVSDGLKNHSRTRMIVDDFPAKHIEKCYLPLNVGANGFYGHRVYAAFTHLIDTKYVLYLDQDCWLEPNHVQACIETIENNNLDWSYSLRNITDKDGNFLCQDNCESLGKWPVFSGDYNHIDTNCYCLRTDHAIKLASVWHGGWGQDRVWFNVLSQAFSDYNCTGQYTINYRVAGNEGSVKPEFFNYGNKIMYERYNNGSFPWRK